MTETLDAPIPEVELEPTPCRLSCITDAVAPPRVDWGITRQRTTRLFPDRPDSR